MAELDPRTVSIAASRAGHVDPSRRKPQRSAGSLPLTSAMRLVGALFVMIVCSRVLYSSNSVENVFGIPFLQEGVYACALVYSVLRLFFKRERADFGVGLLAPLFVITAMLLSALFAWLTFGQPLQFGLLEERRMCALLIGLLLFDLLSDRRLRERHIFILVGLAVAMVFAMSLATQSGIVDLVGGREGRFRTIGQFFVLLALFLLHRQLTLGGWLSLILVALCLYAIVFISQTRILSLGFALSAALLIASKRPVVSVIAGVMVSVSLMVAVLIWPEMLDVVDGSGAINDASMQVRLYSFGFFSDYLAQNRYLAGIGALSLQWNEGFFRLASGRFREHVFLSDLGIFGEYCRYGIMYVPLMAWLSWIMLRGRPRAGVYGERFYTAGLIFMLICCPTLGTFSGQGEPLALLLTLGLWFKRYASL